MSHESVADAAVVGVPDERSGEVPRAFVVAAPGHCVDVAAVKDFVATKTSKYKHLTGGVEVVEAIPKSMSGKILRRKLKEMVLQA